MGWFDRFFPPDPTASWPEQPPFNPEMDLRRSAVSGIALGEPADALRRWGRPDPRPRRFFLRRRPKNALDVFNYSASSLVVEVEEGLVCYFGINVTAGSHEVLPAATLINPNGEQLALGSRTRLEDIQTLLGLTPSRDEDPEEIVDTYVVAGQCVEVEASVDGRIARVYLFAADL